MKTLLYILFLILCISCDKQTDRRCDIFFNRCKTPSLIIFSGESNSGGKAENLMATTHELSVRNGLKILNNNSLLFESLDIPINNIIGHAGYNLSESIHQHGWELGLANAIDSGKMPNPTFIVKTGQGGSSIANWSMTGAAGYRYWDSLTKRVDKARQLLMNIGGDNHPKMYLFYSQGINDIHVWHTDMYVWKAATKAHFANLRARYGFMPIFMTLLPASFNSYNPVIIEICNEIPDCYAIQTSDATGDATHWDYAGQKLIVSRMIKTLREHYNYY